MNRRILVLACGQLLLGGAGLVVIARQDVAVTFPSPWRFVVFTVALTLLSLLPRVYVEHDRHGSWITPSDVALLTGLFTLGPYGFVAASLVADLVIATRFRQTALKTLFNLATMFGGAVAAATTFALWGHTEPLDPIAWLGGLLALAAVTAWDVLAGAWVLAMSEGHRLRASLVRLVPAAAISMLLAAALGLVALILFEETGPGVLLFVPVLGILVLSTRAVSQQRAERHRLEQLYEASAGLAELDSLPSVLAKVGTQARGLVIGSASLCCVVRDDGTWSAILVDDHGPREASATVVDGLLQLAADSERGEIASAGLDRRVRRDLPAFASITWAARGAQPAGRLVLAVLRELPTDEQCEHREGLLAAFVAHAASVVANSQLHGDVRRALDRQLELNRQKSQFVAAVSHELRTPLAGMIGAVQTVRRLEERMPAEDRAGLLDLGLSQGSRLQRLIEDLLLVAATDHQDLQIVREDVDVHGVLAELAAELGPSMGGRVVPDTDRDAGCVPTDADKVRRILVNLVENAHKYAPDGPIELAARRSGGSVEISVSDHGPGIPAEHRDRVFERFVQLDQSSTRRQGGTGLGLHLSRQLAELLGGELEVTEAPSGGARFVLTLPLQEGPARPQPAPAPIAARPGGAALRRPATLASTRRPADDQPNEPASSPVGATS